MSKDKKATDPMAEAQQAAMAAMSDWQKAGFGSLGWAGTDWVKSLGDMNGEVMRFVSDRIEKDVSIQQKIMQAKDITQLQGIQSEFLRDAFDQYAAETGKLIEMGNEMMAKIQTKAADKD